MSYRRTIDAYAAAEEGDTTAAAALPLSEWSEVRRDMMTPQTIAHNHATHVSGTAYELREVLRETHPESGWALSSAESVRIADAARALLDAIGEGAA